MAGEVLVDIISKMAADGIPHSARTDLVYGTVVSTNPWKIKVESEKDFVLSHEFLVFSPWCKIQTITISNQAHNHLFSVDLPVHNHIVDVAGEEHSHAIPYTSNVQHQHKLSDDTWTSAADSDVVNMPSDTASAALDGQKINTSSYDFEKINIETNNTTVNMNLSAKLGEQNLPVSGNTITLNKGLNINDRVIMLRFASGNKFYVLHKEE